jgi:hypothetical protein
VSRAEELVYALGPFEGDCAECGGRLLWVGSGWVDHSPEWHKARRRILLNIVRRRLREELVYRSMAQDAARNHGSVLVMWRIVMPTDVFYATTETSGDVWDLLPVREELLAAIGRKMRDDAEAQFGIRPHPMRVKYRAFDERACVLKT